MGQERLFRSKYDIKVRGKFVVDERSDACAEAAVEMQLEQLSGTESIA